MPNTREKLIELIQSAVGGCAEYWAMVIADHLIDSGVTVQEWISVKDRLPEKSKEIEGEVYYRNVAVRVKNLLHERIAYYDPEHECWYDTGFFQLRGVTHWAELPEWEN